MGTTIDLRRHIDRQPITLALGMVALLCFTVVLADGMNVVVMGFVAPAILRAWGVSRQAFGLVMSAAPLGLGEDWTTLSWNTDVDAAVRKIGPLMHVDADLRSFFKRGGKVVRTRPICAWPSVATYNGTSDVTNAASFTCTEA